nr:hypothetical protein [Spirochaetaceae bacterium]
PVDKCKEYSLAAQAILYILGGVPLALFGKKLGYRKILDDEMEKLFKVLPYVSYGFEEKQLLLLESLKDSVTLEKKIREKGLFHVLKLISETKGLLEEIAKDTENLLKALESIKENRMMNINKDEDIDSYIH